MLKIVHFLSVFCISIISSAQVNGVKLFLEPQLVPKKFNVYAIITQGSAMTTAQRISYASTISILVPNGSSVSIDSVFNPVRSFGALTWALSDLRINPIPSDSIDYYQFLSDPSPTAYYPIMAMNDTIKLFSLNIDPKNADCKQKIRFFNNNYDPSSSNPAMGGSDFKNGIYISNGGTNDYQGVHQIPQLLKVITTANDGIGSLRRACNCALDGSNIEIEVAPSDTIHLDSTLMINKNLTIKGKYINNRIKKNITTPIFDIETNKTLTLQDIDLVVKPSAATIRGIHNKGTLILNNVIVRDQGINTNSGTTIRNEGIIKVAGLSKILKS